MIAVTGAAGFIGSTLAHRLAGDGHSLLLADTPTGLATSGNLSGLERHRAIGHRSFLAELEAGLLKPEAVFHLGACSSTTETDWNFLLDVNVGYSQRLWRCCAAAGIPLYYASSAATYGDGSAGFDDATPPAELAPLNLYGKSKNDFDDWCLAGQTAGAAAPPRWAGFKFFNVYGPREIQKGRMASIVWQTYQQVLKTGSMKLFRSTSADMPDGGQQRDFVYVEDCVDHMLWCWKNGPANAIYNSGTGRARTFLDLANATFDALGRRPNIDFIDMPADLVGQYQSFTQATTAKLQAAGYDRPATLLEDGVRQTVLGYVGMRRAA